MTEIGVAETEACHAINNASEYCIHLSINSQNLKHKSH